MERIPGWLAIGALALAVMLAGVLAGGRPAAHAAGPSDVLPDLVADPPTHPSLDYYAYPDGSHDLLLRFDGYIHNAGAGAFDVRGSRTASSDPMPPLQRVFRSDGTFHDDAMPANAELLYSNADGHHHWHLQSIARYSLWSPDRAAEVAPALKVGFCLGDVEHVDAGVGPSSAFYDDAHGERYCQKDAPNTLSLLEGVSAGWRDVYDHKLALQWVVVSDVQPGDYWLREDVDPTGIVHESNEANAPAWSAGTATIPGYVARAVTAPATPYGHSQPLTLGANAYGAPGARRFRVVTPPAHGTLSVASGTDFTDPAVTYTPASGYSGPDQFTYQAADSTSPYPVHPGTATVALRIGAAPAPSVVIDSAPTSVRIGSGVQLHATVHDDFPGVTWSVDGVDGGSARSGRITPAGFYSAPATVPPSGQVTIAARSSSGAHDQRVVKVTAPPPPPPSPGTNGSDESKGILGSIGTALQGRLLAASVTPKRAGVAWIKAQVGKRVLGSCKAKTPKGRRFTCRIGVPRGLKLDRLKIVARLLRNGKVVARVYRVGKP